VWAIPVTRITGAIRRSFSSEGYAVIPAVLDAGQLGAARAMVASLLAAEPPEPGHAGPYFLWPRFGPAGHPLLDLYRSAGIAAVAAELLRDGLAPDEPGFAQLAVTYPPYPQRPGGPHVDGITPGEPDGRPGTFSLLAGIWLTGQDEPGQGNLWVWPGTHLRFGAWLAENGADALAGVADRYAGPYPPVELGDPVQVTGAAGSVLFAHYLLAHNIGNHDGPASGEPRQTVYYRLRAPGHVARWRQAATEPLLEFRHST
jgi:hypothetical protein